MSNTSFNNARTNKLDEFYTQLEDIEKELQHYTEDFKDKIIFCNCDDPMESNFWLFFKMRFDMLGLQKLITTHYNQDGNSYKLVIDGTKRDKDGHPVARKTALKGDGDFRSDEAIRILKTADIVVTNPPFSLFREYIAQLLEYEKDFIILGNQNTSTYYDIFKHIQADNFWFGVHYGNMRFEVPDTEEYTASESAVREDGKVYRKFGNMVWYTNISYDRRFDDITLIENYKGNEDKYPKYYHYDAIEVSKVNDIPRDYPGVMGVPLTFLNKHNPVQFDIVGVSNQYSVDFEADEELLVIDNKGQKTDRKIVKTAFYVPYEFIKAKKPNKKPSAYKPSTGELYSRIYDRILIRHRWSDDE